MGGWSFFASGANIGRSMFLLVMGIFLKGIFADLLLFRAHIPSICIYLCLSSTH